MKTELKNIIIGGIENTDFPKFTDAYIESAEDKHGNKLTEIELEKYEKDNPDFVSQYLISKPKELFKQ